MGDFFPEAQKVSKETQPGITNYDTLLAEVNSISQRSQNQIDEGIKVLTMIRKELFGVKTDIRGSGLIHSIRQDIDRDRRWAQLSEVQKMSKTVDRIEEFNKWAERHIQFLEEYIKGFDFLLHESLKFIDDSYRKIDKINEELSITKDRVNELTDEVERYRKGEIRNEQLTDAEMSVLRIRFDQYFAKYVQQSDPLKKGSVKAGMISTIARDDERKRLILYRWWDEMEKGTGIYLTPHNSPIIDSPFQKLEMSQDQTPKKPDIGENA